MKKAKYLAITAAVSTAFFSTVPEGGAQTIPEDGLEGESSQHSGTSSRTAKAKILPTVEVRSSTQTDATSEGSGSYAAIHATVGGKDATSLLEIPQSVSVITRQRIEDQNLVSAEEALREVTGVTVTPWDGATFQIRSRGYFLEPSYDGIPSFGGLNATQQFDIAMFDRIEVLRGPAGLFQGSGQPGGTVNFARRKGLAEFGGSAAATVGSWSHYRAEANVGGALNSEGTLRSRIVTAVHDRGFYYDRAKSQKQMVYGTLDFDLSRDTTISLYGAYQLDKTNPFSGLPAYSDGRFLDVPRSRNPYPSWAVYDTTTAMLATELEHRLQNGWKLRARYSHYRQGIDLRDSFPTSGVNPTTGLVSYARRGWDTESKRDLVDVYVSGPFSALGRQHMLTAGWNYSKSTSDTDYGPNDTIPNLSFLRPDLVPQLFIPPYVRGYDDETIQSGVYGQARLNVTDAATVVLGARSTNFRVRNRNSLTGNNWTPGARESGEVTPYAALVIHLASDMTAYTSYSDIFMPQTARDFTGRVLDPRVGKQIEMGLKKSFYDGRLQAALSIFRTRDVNRSLPDVANPGFSIQAGEVEISGWDAEVSGSPLKNLQMTLGYSRLDTKYLTHQTLAGTAFTLFEPKHTIKAYANYRIAGTPWSVGGGAQGVSALIGTGQAGIREQGGYVVTNAQLGYQFNERSSLTFSVNNFFDRNYYARVGGLNSYNTYGDPRNASLTYRTRF